MAQIGFVGLGAMGSRIAARLLAAGHEVYGYNRTSAKASPLIERGLLWRDSPRAVAESAEVTLSMVRDTAALEAVASGAEGILAGLEPGKVWVDLSAVSPSASRAFAERAAALGASMVDAPVSGSLPAAEAGELSIMAGGDEHAIVLVEPILREIGQSVGHVGDNGQAQLMKLAVNLSLAVQMLAFSEGVLLAERGGLQRELAVATLTESAIGSPMLKARGPLVLGLSDEAWFTVELMQKDLVLAFEEARELRVPLPTSTVANELLTAARGQGRGERDVAVLFDVLADVAGLGVAGR